MVRVRGVIKHRDAHTLAGTSKGFRRIEVACVLFFPLAWLTLLARTWSALKTPAFAGLAALAGLLLADFISGLFHWLFDTWFTPETPIVGRTFVRTFREHHADPTAICRHDFVETNGSNVLAGGFLVVLGHMASDAFTSAWLLFAGLFMSATSQIHKWAHAEHVPRPVALLQRLGLILNKAAHGAHHAAPFDQAYCITAGWLNTMLQRMHFFRTLERAISAITGALPRRDDIGVEAATLRSADDVDGDAGVVVPTVE
jgi:ubiquitin-conjugating enzyme E2 variant